MKAKIIISLLFLTTFFSASAQEYQYPTEPEVLENIRQWQDLKFGLFMHWGAYSIWGIVESWTLCSEDWEWNKRPPGISYNQYVKTYEMLPQYFNPVNFDPDKWSKAAKEAGMRYVVFTTKHHDGFCMFDSKYTDYKITDLSVPFHKNPKADVANEIFKSFRKEGFPVGAYFSKPDWHHPDFWAPEWATPDRNVNYDTRKYPERWESFKDFTYHQIEELMTRFGKIDILWLDGGWVRPFGSAEEENKAAGQRLWNQDVDMPRIAKMARGHQPGIIIVDRSVTGIYENYRTPEQEIPEQTLPYPWETCMTMAGQWSFNAHDTYKSTHQIVQMLAQVVSRGGNLLLNIGPSPAGDFHPTAYQRLKEIGSWMKINSEAIYGTKPVTPYHETKTVFTRKGKDLYTIYLADETEINMPAEILIESFHPVKGGSVYLLGYNQSLTWKVAGKGCIIQIPASLQKNPPCRDAWILKFQPAL